MSWRKNPPLPSAVRPGVWAVRILAVFVAAGSLSTARLAIDLDRWSLASMVLVLGFGFVVLTWIHPQSRWFPVAVVGIIVTPAVLAGSWPIALVSIVGAAVAVWFLKRPLGLSALGLDPDKVVEIEPDAVQRNAEPFVEQFTSAGYQQKAAIQFTVRSTNVTESLMLSPDSRSYATVTDAIVSVTSVFPGDLQLVTRNSGQTELPPNMLADNVPGGSPYDLIESHQKSLELVAELGHHPIPIAAGELAQIAIESERAGIAWMNGSKSVQPSTSKGPLWKRPERYEQIGAWHTS